MQRELAFVLWAVRYIPVFQAMKNNYSWDEHRPQEKSIFLCLTNTIDNNGCVWGEAPEEGADSKLVKIAHCKPEGDDWT